MKGQHRGQFAIAKWNELRDQPADRDSAQRVQVMDFGNSHPFAPRDAEAGTTQLYTPQVRGFFVASIGLFSYRAFAIKWGSERAALHNSELPWNPAMCRVFSCASRSFLLILFSSIAAGQLALFLAQWHSQDLGVL